jgi:histidinol-phosphate aminotransferase
VAAIEDQPYFEEIWHRVVESRGRLVTALGKLDFEVVPSAANFVFARHSGRTGAELAVRLRERGIVVRNFHNPARIAPYLRITVGTDAQCQALIAALSEILLESTAAAPSSALS